MERPNQGLPNWVYEDLKARGTVFVMIIYTLIPFSLRSKIAFENQISSKWKPICIKTIFVIWKQDFLTGTYVLVLAPEWTQIGKFMDNITQKVGQIGIRNMRQDVKENQIVDKRYIFKDVSWESSPTPHSGLI